MQALLRRQPERAVGAAGLLFVVLYAVPAILWGGVQADEPAAQVAHELIAHRGAAVASAYALLAASVFLLIFAAGTSRLGDARGAANRTLSACAFGAGAIAAALLAAANAVLGALGGYIIDGSAPDTVRALNGVWDALTTASGLFLGVLALLISLLAFESRALPTWMRWLGIVAGLVLVVGSGSLATPFRGVGPFWLLGLLGTLVWIVATSVRLLVRRPA